MLRFVIAIAAVALVATAEAQPAPTAAASASMYVVDHYSPTADPSADLARAVERAGREHKRILLVVGGDWCIWCHILDDYLAGHADVHTAFANAFVVVKVNHSPQNTNELFLSAYRTSPGYPDFIILESDGRYLGTQDTSALEEGRGYNRDRMSAFARRWAQP
jgi:thioredoxin-related protein